VTPEILLLLAIVTVALVLFTLSWIPEDVVALGVMLSLVVTGLLEPQQAFAGFGSDTVLMILGVLIMTAALLRTGVVEMAGRAILRRAGTDPYRLLVVVTVSVATLSAFISNTAAAAFFLPIVMGVALKARISPSRFLLPMAFAAIITSSVTIISTSTNIVVSGIMTDYGLDSMGMFELAPVGIPIAIVGLLYLLTLGRRLIPERESAADLMEEFGLGPYLTEVIVQPRSKLVGKTLVESGLGKELDLSVLRILRGNERLAPSAQRKLQGNDILIVEGKRAEILKVKDAAGLEIKGDVKLAKPALEGDDLVLVEAMLMPGSPLIGRRLGGYRFRERHGLQVLAIHRHGENLREKLSRLRLRLGDALLIQGHPTRLAEVEEANVLSIVGKLTDERPKLRHAWVAVTIFAVAVVVATLKILPLAVAFMLGAFFTFVTRCITPQEAYREIEWKALILIGSMLALGAAMQETGAAEYLAGLIVDWTGDARPFWLLTGFFVLTVALTQPMSNQAAAIVVLPLAIQTAIASDLNPRTFAMMIAVAASTSYLTPLEPACLIVYGPGRYRFFDFLKVGAPLTVMIYIVAILLVPLVWPLE
jgi:di/tricarboxylate transporter